MSQPQGAAGSVQARAQEVVKEDFFMAMAQVNDAASSGSYLYPIKACPLPSKCRRWPDQTRPDQTRLGLFDRQTDANQTGQGIVYFASHRALWKPFLSRVAPTLAVSAAVTVPMFIFTYLPQLAVLVWVNGPLAMFTTVLLVLNESSTITSMIARNFIMQDALLDTFDGTLVSRGATAAVKEGRELQPGSDPVGKLGKVLMSPFERFSPNAIVRYLIHLPLNFIPVVGTAIFLLLQGRTRGLGVHDRYFQLKSWSKERRSDWIQTHVGSYTAFGLVATLLEMVPVASLLFSFTNAVGAALWAADIEAKDVQTAEKFAGKKYK